MQGRAMSVDGPGCLPEMLLRQHLKKLKRPSVLREHEKLARQCATEGVDLDPVSCPLIELDLLDARPACFDRRILTRSLRP